MTTAKRFIEYMPLGKIRSAEVNPKEHDAPTITASVRRFGLVESMQLDDRTGRLVAGHGRYAVLLALKARGKKPPDGVEVRDDGEWLVPVQRGWASADDGEARAYVVTSNKSSEGGGWNEELLAIELAAIADDTTMGLMGTGVSEAEFADMVDEEPMPGKKKKRGAGGKKARQQSADVFQVLVEVDSEKAQAALLERLEKEGFKCRPLIF